MYGKFQQMQEESCEILPRVSGKKLFTAENAECAETTLEFLCDLGVLGG
jgi:hypothetical protein